VLVNMRESPSELQRVRQSGRQEHLGFLIHDQGFRAEGLGFRV
jgi:hypothetical protein